MVGRWARALHNLYVVTLAGGLVATVATFPPGLGWLVAGTASGALVAADFVVRQRSAASRGYFVAVAVVVGILTGVFPTFAPVAFGALPLAFVLLPRLAAIGVGVLLTGMPYLTMPVLNAWMHLTVSIRVGLVYLVVIGVALPVLTGLLTAMAI